MVGRPLRCLDPFFSQTSNSAAQLPAKHHRCHFWISELLGSKQISPPAPQSGVPCIVCVGGTLLSTQHIIHKPGRSPAFFSLTPSTWPTTTHHQRHPGAVCPMGGYFIITALANASPGHLPPEKPTSLPASHHPFPTQTQPPRHSVICISTSGYWVPHPVLLFTKTFQCSDCTQDTADKALQDVLLATWPALVFTAASFTYQNPHLDFCDFHDAHLQPFANNVDCLECPSSLVYVTNLTSP